MLDRLPVLLLKELVLFNCKFKNPYILSRFPLHTLRMLDLSLNRITNINFLRYMRTPKMKIIYLNHNKIGDIQVLLNQKVIPKLRMISLNKNILDFNKKGNDIKALSTRGPKGIIVDIIKGYFDEDDYEHLNNNLIENYTKSEKPDINIDKDKGKKAKID